jgi:hypothetical protein
MIRSQVIPLWRPTAAKSNSSRMLSNFVAAENLGQVLNHSINPAFTTLARFGECKR